MSVRPVQFSNSDGELLHGMLHVPTGRSQSGAIVILLSPGVKMRVAPHRLYIKWSSVFVDLGYSVLRFDFNGLGDSEGAVEEELLADLYGGIQTGKYICDTQAAMRWLAATYGYEKFIFAGLCGGAITGLLAGRDDDRVLGLLGLGIPTILDGSNIDKSKFITGGQLDSLSKGYLGKLFDIGSWKRLLSFQSDYKTLVRALAYRLFRRKSTQKRQENVEIGDNTNPLFAPALFQYMERGARVCLVFSGSDRLGWEYEEKIAGRYRRELEALPQGYLTIQNIENANHILTRASWQKELMRITVNWMADVHPVQEPR